MATAYYSDAMRQFVSNLDNPLGIQVDISEFEDRHGRYLILFVDKSQVEGKSPEELSPVADYLVALRAGLIQRGARATFMFGGSDD